MEMEFAGRTQLLRIASEGGSETRQTRINQRCRGPLATPAQEIAAIAVSQITVGRNTIEWEKMPRLPCATQTDASWTFTCETETNIPRPDRSRLAIQTAEPFPRCGRLTSFRLGQTRSGESS